MAGNMKKDIYGNQMLINPKNQSDINQNFVAEQKLFQQGQASGIRGLNSNKPSPDSGWTFPTLIPPQLYPTVLPPPTNFMVNNQNINGQKALPDITTLTADFRSGSTNRDLNLSSVHGALNQEHFQNKSLTPYLELNLRQQQQMFENSMFTPSPSAAAYNFMKAYDNSSSFGSPVSNSTFGLDNKVPTPNIPMMPVMNFRPNLNGDIFSKTNNMNQGTLWSHMGPNVTPIGTPATEGKRITDSFLPYTNNNLSINNCGDGNSLMPAALFAAQMNNYMALMRQNNLKLNQDSSVAMLQSTVNNLSKPNNSPSSTIHPMVNKMGSNNLNTPQSLTEDSTWKTTAVTKHDEIYGFTGKSNHSDVASSDMSHTGGSRSYQVTSSHSDNTSVVESTINERQSPRPLQRPNHIGSGFVPQTQFLTVNVNHGTPQSDKESVHSSISPSQASPYSTGHHSGSPSPRGDRKLRTETSCSQCGKQFSSSSALAKHKLIHSDERKYVCHICSRGFKRQDHLNGHMVTHRDKKPYECNFADCGKSYCDTRSLRRHLENHHGGPPGGATPAGYMPKLMSHYPGFEENSKSDPYHRHNVSHDRTSSSRLEVPSEPPRPSSAPLVAQPEPQRVTRTRRSSSGEESGVQLDPGMLRELEMRRNYHASVLSEEYKKPLDDYARSSSADSNNHLLKTTGSVMPRSMAAPYDSHMEHARKLAFDREQQRLLEIKRSEYERLHSGHPDLKDLYAAERRHKEYENGTHKKHDYSPKGLPPASYPHGIPSIATPRFPWSQHYPPTGHSPNSSNMPYLLNIRNPLGFPPHGSYYPHQSETPTGENSKLSKTEFEARQQAMNTYFQMLANGQHGSLTSEQLYMYTRGYLPGQNAPTVTDPTAIAIAAAKELHDRPMFHGRESLYGIHPTNAQWQPVIQDDSKDTREKDVPKTSSYFHPPSSSVQRSATTPQRYVPPPTTERNIIDEPFKPSESNHFHRYRHSPQTNTFDSRSRSAELPHSRSGDTLARGMDYPPYPHERSGALEGIPHKGLDKSRSLEPPQHLEVSPAINRFDANFSTPSPNREPPKDLKPPLLRVETADPITTPSPLSPNKKRPRPGPIIIPPAVNNRNSTSPHKGFPRNIYTPPAMLSPKSVFFNPPGFAQRHTVPNTPGRPVPSTPGRVFLSIRRSTSVDQRETPLAKASVSSDELQIAEVPEPKINVGIQFQAVLPTKLNRTEAQKDIHRASLMWSPLKESEQKEEEVNSYLDMACSLALYGGSNNKEYALHILQRTRGNVKEAVRLLLSRRHILRADDPNADYHYSGSVRWTAKERLAFRQAYRQKGKVFMHIQKEVATKSVQLCVEFYYLWKAMHPESFRARTRMVEVESEQDDEEVPPTPTAAVAPLSTLREPVFECDYPECRARFVSRQALNGHIRVHGGSMTKPNEIRRPKTKTLVSPDMGNSSSDVLPSPAKKRRPAAPSSVIVSGDGGQQLQFQCKVCGRVFNKVKSRSAHMKTHVKRDDNNKPIKQNKQQKELHLQQQREHFLQQQRQQMLAQQQQQQANENKQPQQQTHSINPLSVYAH